MDIGLSISFWEVNVYSLETKSRHNMICLRVEPYRLGKYWLTECHCDLRVLVAVCLEYSSIVDIVPGLPIQGVGNFHCFSPLNRIPSPLSNNLYPVLWVKSTNLYPAPLFIATLRMPNVGCS